jgi:hypothetical protein
MAQEWKIGTISFPPNNGFLKSGSFALISCVGLDALPYKTGANIRIILGQPCLKIFVFGVKKFFAILELGVIYRHQRKVA